MEIDRSSEEHELLSQADAQAVSLLLALAPTSTQLIAALHETFAKETGVAPLASEAIPAETMPTEAVAGNADAEAHSIDGAGSDAAGESPDWPGPTLHERARQIDPRSGGAYSAFWGEWISPDQRTVSRALCWYPRPDRFDVVPDWAMREAWPEYEHAWEQLLQSALDRHRHGRHSVGFDDLPF